MIIALDGPAAAGKGTLARRLAAHFDLAYLDTGALYRALALLALREGLDLDDADAVAQGVARLVLDQAQTDPALRTREVGAAASRVAAHAPVRRALLQLQRDFARGPRGAVLDGRDIGTVVCPDADLKLFVTADLTTRARRRADELRASGRCAEDAAIEAELAERDRRDTERADAPLKPALDAVLLDTSDLSIDAAFEAARRLVEAVMAAGEDPR